MTHPLTCANRKRQLTAAQQPKRLRQNSHTSESLYHSTATHTLKRAADSVNTQLSASNATGSVDSAIYPTSYPASPDRPRQKQPAQSLCDLVDDLTTGKVNTRTCTSSNALNRHDPAARDPRLYSSRIQNTPRLHRVSPHYPKHSFRAMTEDALRTVRDHRQLKS